MEKYIMTGIYCYTNKINGMQYVGQSIDIEQRKYQHEHSNIHDGAPFHKALETYGVDNFIFSVLEECKPEELNEKETFWITKLNTYSKGYNCNIGGNQFSLGEMNPRTNFTDVEVLNIRKRIHINKEDIKDVYKEFENRISYNRF